MIFSIWWMWIGHFVCDFPLQGDFLARAKNHLDPIPGIPWVWGLLAHSMIHAGWVYMVTGDLVLSACELVTHMGVDWLKSNKTIGFVADQCLHLLYKVIWACCLM